MSNISEIRKDYRLRILNEADVDADPMLQFEKWWREALTSQLEEVNAMTLATADKAGKPSARIVLLKGFEKGGFIFFTNYHSQKAQEIAENPFVSLLFFWKELERQVRIEGTISKVSDADSDNYFRSRPIGSKIGAWASPQSSIISSREVIEENVVGLLERFGEKEIDRPPHWGGYMVQPNLIEFWQGRSNRLHDRLQYIRNNTGSWKLQRLAP